MANTHQSSGSLQPQTFTIPAGLMRFIWGGLFIGFVSFAVGFNFDRDRVWQSFLTSLFFFVSLALGGLFFTAIQHIAKAGWSVTVRRLAEAMTAFLPYGAVATLVLLGLGSHSLYEWLHLDVVAKDPLLQKKVAYLNMSFFSVRTVVFFALWLLLSKIIVGNSLKQDKSGSEQITLSNLKWSIAFIIIFALSYSLFSVDYLMSLDPHWFSTMFGVYTFSGLFQSSLAFMILMALFLKSSGYLNGLVNENHLHDLGKLMFAFTIFYAYIAFSQFMLIWYANIPEETIFFLHRAYNGWMGVSLSLFFLKFVVPFLILLPRDSKRNPTILKWVSVLLLAMQYVDNYWLIYPNFHEAPVFGIWEVGIFVGFLALFLFAITRFLSKNSIVAIKDPRIQEALHHHT